MKLTIEDLKNKNLILFECISGSKAYNLDTEKSDTDIRGIFYLPKELYYGLEYQAQVSNASNDIVYYEIGRFFELLLKNNPACLEILATPDEFILYKSPLLKELNYKNFITDEVKNTFIGYALSQIKKAKGLNKKFLNPMAKKRRSILDFCFIVNDGKSILLNNWLEEKNYKEKFCGLSKIHHAKDLYSVFYNEKLNYNGIIKDENSNDIHLSEIPKNEMPICYLIFNKDEYSSYCKQYKEYWDWMKLRNEDRYTTNIDHGKDYDSKNMMHTIRLLRVAKELLLTGDLNVKRTMDRDELLRIKNGKYSYDEVLKISEDLQSEIRKLPTNIHSINDNYETNEKFLINLRTKLYE